MSIFPFSHIIFWYKKNGRHFLPWRNYDFDEKILAYRIWLSEVLLQQTQTSRGAQYFTKIIEKYPTIEILANTRYDIFFEYYKGLGYYNRAKNLLKTAKIITQEYKGFFPKETEKLIKLPGIGPYTAEAIRAFAFEIPTLSFDTNLEKIFSRFYYGNRFIKLKKREKEKILKDFLKTQISSRDFNNACMDFGAIVSVNNKNYVNFENYPLVNDIFFKTKGKNEPVKQKKIFRFPRDKAEIRVILHNNHKEYFSENEIEFQPFILPKTNEKNKRAYIKKYFLEKYNIEVSVRPIHKMDYVDEIYFMICNAQIQKGKNNFFVFHKI